MKLSTSEAIHGKDLEIFESDFELRRITVERQSWNAIIWSICPTSLRSNDFHFCALPVSLESQEKSQRGVRDFFFFFSYFPASAPNKQNGGKLMSRAIRWPIGLSLETVHTVSYKLLMRQFSFPKTTPCYTVMLCV